VGSYLFASWKPQEELVLGIKKGAVKLADIEDALSLLKVPDCASRMTGYRQPLAITGKAGCARSAQGRLG